MRRKRSLIASVACGALCALCVAVFLQQVTSQTEKERAEALARYGGEQLEVCVATRNISAGEKVSAGDVELRLWLVDMLPKNALLSVDEVVGRSLASNILANEVLAEEHFAVSAYRLEVPDGYTALSLPARDVQAVGGAIEKGMRIDVYATGNTSTQAIAKGALVLSTSIESKGSLTETSSQWITIAALPASVQELVKAAQTMQLYFVLPGENVTSQEESESSKDLSAQNETVNYDDSSSQKDEEK